MSEEQLPDALQLATGHGGELQWLEGLDELLALPLGLSLASRDVGDERNVQIVRFIDHLNLSHEKATLNANEAALQRPLQPVEEEKAAIGANFEEVGGLEARGAAAVNIDYLGADRVPRVKANRPVEATAEAPGSLEDAGSPGGGGGGGGEPEHKRQKVKKTRRRNELYELRAEAMTLGLQLDKLMKEHADKSKRLGSAWHYRAGWRGVAYRQLQRRIQSETLNRELRLQVRQRHIASQQLVDMLRSEMAAISPSVGHTQGGQSIVRFQESDVRRVSAVVSRMDDMCAQTNSVLRLDQIPSIGSEKAYSSQFLREWDQDYRCTFVAIADALMIPFSFTDATPAITKSLPAFLGQESPPAMLTSSKLQDTFAIKFLFGPYECVTVVRASYERDRAVFMWRSFATEIGGTSDIEIVNLGWTSAQSADSSDSATLLQSYSRWHIDGCDPGTDSEHLDMLSDQLFGSAESDAMVFAQAIENLLLDERAAKKHGAAAIVSSQ